MARYGDYDRYDDDYDIRVGRGRDRDQDQDAGPKPHSGVGITSIFCAIFTLVGYSLVMLVSVALAMNNPQMGDNDPKVIALGVGVLLAGCANFVGLLIGFIGCFQSDRNILCPVVGTVLNGILLLSMGLLILLGLLVGG